MSKTYKGVDLKNALKHYGRPGMKKGRHLPGTTWWQEGNGKRISGSSVMGSPAGSPSPKYDSWFDAKLHGEDPIKFGVKRREQEVDERKRKGRIYEKEQKRIQAEQEKRAKEKERIEEEYKQKERHEKFLKEKEEAERKHREKDEEDAAAAEAIRKVREERKKKKEAEERAKRWDYIFKRKFIW
jgi:hypothetical protein